MIWLSTSEFSFIQMAAVRPALAWAISSRMCARMRVRMPCGLAAITSISAGSA